MSFVTLQSSVPLTSYAQAHIQELAFGENDTPPSNEIQFETRKVNLFGRCIKKIDSAKSCLAKLGRALLIIFLTLSIVGIPIVIAGKRESNLSVQDEKAKKLELENLEARIKQWNKRAEIHENLGVENFVNLPILDLCGRMGSTDYIDFLAPGDLRAPIMKGIDKYKRPFISMKMKDKEQKYDFVITIFQRYSKYDERWCNVGCHGANPLSRHDVLTRVVVGPEEEQILGQIIRGTHPRFSLA